IGGARQIDEFAAAQDRVIGVQHLALRQGPRGIDAADRQHPDLTVGEDPFRHNNLLRPPGGGRWLSEAVEREPGPGGQLISTPCRKALLRVMLPAQPTSLTSASWLTAKRSGFKGTMLRSLCGRKNK